MSFLEHVHLICMCDACSLLASEPSSGATSPNPLSRKTLLLAGWTPDTQIPAQLGQHILCQEFGGIQLASELLLGI